ncbi:hypothetical protein [Actimicrobium antarcticum]|uniref:hypothetical protein n=1 Tax=Actimicrobium antarcticum TaxID=1051899 RepID=UPI0031DD6BC8
MDSNHIAGARVAKSRFFVESVARIDACTTSFPNGKFWSEFGIFDKKIPDREISLAMGLYEIDNFPNGKGKEP